MKPFFISIPHSGEEVPNEAKWLRGLPEPLLMCDVDRFVDRLYDPVIRKLTLPVVKTRWHRYVVDLNRLPSDVDADSVLGSEKPSGKFTTGLHWVKTTKGERLMPNPITSELHNHLVDQYFEPFHQSVRDQYAQFKAKGYRAVFHLDAHSMPSMGTKAHRDPGERRADVVVSDFEGRSCDSKYKDIVYKAFEETGLKVAYNWPYIGGRVTQTYGHPKLGQHAIQVELNRDLYMNETSKQWIQPAAEQLSARIEQAIEKIYRQLPEEF